MSDKSDMSDFRRPRSMAGETSGKSATIRAVDVIVSHTNADFDALASMVAASLLYPAAVMSLPGGADRNVREFLSLHGDVIQSAAGARCPARPGETSHRGGDAACAPPGALRRVARTPGGARDALRPPCPATSHRATPMRRYLEAYGANTTLMVRLLRQHGIAIDALQATLFALGIYEDTGSLTFSTTTPEDVETVAWLLRQGRQP